MVRNTCSTVSVILVMALSVCIASSRDTTFRRIGKKASMPSALQATASLTTQPEKASTGFSYFLAILATPMGAFHITV